jgi:signal transduction histidine kinase
MPPSSSATGTVQVREDSRARKILSAQIKLLYANASVAVGVTVVAATILALFQWSVVSHLVIVTWWLYLILLSSFRYAVARRYRQGPRNTDVQWRVAFAIGAGLAGAGWGSAGILLYPPAHLTHQIFLIFVLGGMMLGAALLLAPRPEAFLAFLFLTGLGPVARLLAEGDETHVAMGSLGAVFTVATLIATGRIYRMINSSLRLKFENQDLLEDLQAAKDATEALNQVLEAKVQERTAELHKSAELLREEIAERKQVEQELLRAQQALLNSEKLAATSRLAATMAHEINNPLAAITNLLFLLAPLQTNPEAQGYVALMEDQLSAVSRIATQTLKFHRDNNQPTEFTLRAVLGEVLDFYRPQAEKLGVVVHERIHTEGTIVGFRGEIVQVATNLLLNAIEATPVGGKVIVHLYPAPPWLCEVRNHCGYCFSIADSGRGIDAQHRARIFEPFFTTKGDKGTGLGLWLCSGIVNRARGTMRVWSTRRESCSGTCFWVFLPAEEANFTPLRRRYEVGTQSQEQLDPSTG